MSIDWLKSHHESLIREADKLLADGRKLEAEIANLRSEASGIREVEDYPRRPWPDDRLTHESNRENLDTWFAECEKILARNDEAVEHNKRVLKRATAFMVALGLNEKELVQVGRRRNREWQSAGWVTSLERQIPTSHGFRTIKDSYEEAAKRLEDDHKRAQEELARRQREHKQAMERTEKERRKQLVIVAIAERYGCDPLTATASDVRDAILEKDKYARLAYWMERNRGDWGDGPGYASFGLEGFTIETPTDREIFDDIQHHITNWDGDGRIFRDCDWNYGRVMSLASEAVQKDLSAILEFGDDL